MAADTVSSVSNWAVSAVLNYGVLKNFYERPGLKGSATNLGSGAGFGSMAFQVPVWSPGSEVFASTTEAGAITATSQADSDFTCTVAKYALDVQASDELMFAIDGAISANWFEARAEELGAQADNWISQLICDQYTNFTATEGSLTDTLTLDDVMAARADLQVIDGVGGHAALNIHNRAFQDLFASMRAESLDGLFNTSVAALAKFGTVKGMLGTDIIVSETGLVDQGSSAYIGGLYRPPAIGYKHGVPKNLNTWSPTARVMPAKPGELEQALLGMGMALPPADRLAATAELAAAQQMGTVPAIYVEYNRMGYGNTREARLQGTLFIGVGCQIGRGVKIRSVVPS